MTDKQIIINGVDVSGCHNKTFYKNDEGDVQCKCYRFEDADSDTLLFGICKQHPHCYYKQLKRKEQEYEELRQYHNKCCEENAKKEAEWLEKFNQISIGFYNGDYCNTKHCSLLKAKEQECEELKEIINEAQNSKLDLKSFLVGEAIQNEYEQQLYQLKAQLLDQEAETLKAGGIIHTLEQTLTEIKEIAKNGCYDDCGMPLDELSIILQKISEVEDA